MELKQALGTALKARRLEHKLTQEDFSDVSSRTTSVPWSAVRNAPRSRRWVELASVLQIHSLTLIAESFLALEPGQTLEALLEGVQPQAQQA